MTVEKAKAAIDKARELLDGVERDHAGLIPLLVEAEFTNMLAIARVHADVAQAEALERIADVLERPEFSVPEVLDRFADHVARSSDLPAGMAANGLTRDDFGLPPVEGAT